ncbi:MAG: ABC transporter permease [Ruminococcus sp.]|nr:ABC transporter permease [Ruminococcus sp.]
MKPSSLKYLVGQGVRNIWTNRIMSFASFCVLLVSILLVGFTVLVTMNINRFVNGIENKNEVIIFLVDDVSDETIENMGNLLRNTQNVSSVVFYSKEEAFEDMKKNYENADELFGYFDESPLPDAYKIKVSDISEMKMTIATIEVQSAAMNAVYHIKSPDEFANLLTSLKSILTLITTAILVALSVVSMVIISNATKASVFARSREINIMKYVGATDTFIRVPFFVEGMLTGVVAGGIASVVTWFVYEKVIEILSQEMTLWNALGISEFIPYSSIWWKVSLSYIVIGGLFGAVGSSASTKKYLKV